jgi:hypothetical protein
MKSVNPKSPWLGRTEGPCSDTFQPKIFRLKTMKIHEIGKSQKSVVRKDRRSVFGRFSAKNTPFEIRKNNTIYHHIFIRNALNADLRKMLRKHATNGNMPRPCPFSHFA